MLCYNNSHRSLNVRTPYSQRVFNLQRYKMSSKGFHDSDSPNQSAKDNAVCKVCLKSLYRTDRQIEYGGVVLHMTCVNHMLWHKTNCSCDTQSLVNFSLNNTLCVLTNFSQQSSNIKSSNGNMIREAARNNKVAILSQLLNVLLFDSSTIDEADQSGRTALMWASQRGHATCMSLLVKHGANLNAKNQYGYTALMLACLRGNVKCVEILLENGADIKLRNEEGKSALDCAKSEDIKVLLLCHEVKKMPQLNTSSTTGFDPIYHNSGYNNKYLNSYLNSYIPPPISPERTFLR